jgi:hypothetical protein
MGAQKAEGHLETDFVAWGASANEAERVLGEMPLTQAQRALDTLISARDGASTRRWYDAMNDDDGGAA